MFANCGVNHVINIRTMKLFVQSSMYALFFMLFLSPQLSRAQGINFKSIEQIVNTTSSDALEPGALGISVSRLPAHGSVNFTTSSNVISYSPSSNFIGKDTFILKYQYPTTTPSGINMMIFSSRAYEVKIAQSIIKASADYAHTAYNQSVVVDVLANDQTIGGGLLNLSGITLSNNGTAFIANDKLTFTPNTNFSGLAYINYAVCDDAGTCTTGAVTIAVRDAITPSTISNNVTTSKNLSTVLILSNGAYTVNQSATNGTLSFIANNVWRYTPNNNFVGNDVVTFSKTGSNVNFNITVLNKATISAYAKDDYYYTPKNKALSGNVLTNDNANNAFATLVTPPSSNHGTLVLNTNGQFTFTPNANFKGVAKFVYNLTINGIVTNPVINEDATAYIDVNNQNPGKPLFELSTPKNTPLVLNYSIPLSGFTFTVNDPASHGNVVAYSGATSVNLGNTTVNGQSLVVYTPTNNFLGDDEFELNYCINNECKAVKIKVKVENITPSLPSYCVGDCVWSGDANNDGIVDMSDLLMIGYCMGENGAPRQNASMNWFGQESQNWFNPFIPLAAPNLKYMDTNGDGNITDSDTIALSMHYGMTHNIVAEKSINLKQFPIWFKVLTPNPQIGDVVEIEVNLGKAATPVTDMSGFTFSMDYNTSIVHPGSLQVNYDSQSWLTYNSPTLRMSKIPYDGRLDLGYTRTGGTTASGKGKVAILSIVIDGDVEGFANESGIYVAKFKVNGAKMIDAKGTQYSLPSEDLEIPIQVKQTKANLTENSLRLYPVPAIDKVNVHMNGGNTMDEYCVYNVNGQQVHFSGAINGNHDVLDVSQYPVGVYMIQAITKDGVVTKKFTKQ